MAGEDQNIKIGVDAGKAISDLGKFETAVAGQSSELQKILAVMQKYNDVGTVTDAVIKGTTKSGQILEVTYKKIGDEFVKTEATLKKASSALKGYGRGLGEAAVLQRKFTNGQAAVTAALGARFSQFPADATQGSIEELERQQKTLARLIAGRSIKGGAEAFIQEAVKKAETGVFSDRKGILGNVEREVFKVVQAFERVQASSRRAQEEIRRRAEQATAAIKNEVKATTELDEKSQRARSDAAALTALLREDLKVDFSKLSVGKVGAFNAPLNNIQSLVANQKISEQRVQDLFAQIKAKQQTVVNNSADKAAVAALTALIRAQESYNDTLDKTIRKEVELQAKQARRTSAQGFQGFLVNRFGGVREDSSPAQVKSIQSASNALGQLISSGQITRSQFNKVLTAFEKDANVVLTGVAGKAVNAMRTLRNAITTTQTPIEKAVAQLRLLGLTWEGLGRLFLVQVIHSAIARVIGGLEQATTRAAEFSIKVAEIRTLSEGNAVSSRTWATELRNVSDSFGIDLIDTAAGAYDILSNQVAKGTNAIAFLSESAAFAKTTVSSLADSSNLLSSAVNAYKDQSLTATRAAEVLFTTIDLGRVRVEEIADTFGNVLPLGSQLGITFEEINAAFATLTIQGIRADTSMTLLNNIMLKLLRPTKEMQGLLSEWGVSTGQAAISTFGFTGVIEKLIKEFESGGIERIGDIAQEMRTIRGLLSLSGKNSFATLMENTGKVLNDSADNFARAKKVMFEDPGNQFQREATQFKNVLTLDIGNTIFRTALKVAQSVGGVKNALNVLASGLQGPLLTLTKITTTIAGVVDSIRGIPFLGTALGALTPALGGVSTAFVALRLNTLASNIANSEFASGVSNSIKALFAQRAALNASALSWVNLRSRIAGALPLLATAAVFALGTISTAQEAAASARIQAVQQAKRDTDAANQALFKAQQDGFRRFVEVTQSELEKRNRLIRQKNAELVRGLNGSTVELTQETIKQNKLIRDVAGKALSDFKGTLTFDFLINGENEDDPSKSLENIADAIKDSFKASEKLEKSLKEISFANSLAGLAPVDETKAVITEIGSLQGKIFDLFASRNLEGVRNTFEEINALIKEQLIGSTNLDALITKTQDRLDELTAAKSGKKNAGLKAQIASAESKGLELLNLGNLKAANAEFEKADKAFERMQQNEEKVNSALKKLGIAAPTRAVGEEERLKTRLNALKTFELAPQNPNRLLEDSLRQQLGLEELYQKAYAKRLVDYRATLLEVDAENKAVGEQVAVQKQLAQALQTNLETHNQTLSSITEQLSKVREIGQELDNQTRSFTDKFVLFPDPERAATANRTQLAQLAELQSALGTYRETFDQLAEETSKDPSAANLKKLTDAQEAYDQKLNELIEKTKQYKQTIVDVLRNEKTDTGLVAPKGIEGDKQLLEQLFLNGNNAAESLRNLEGALKDRQKESDQIKQQQKELIDKFGSTQDTGFINDIRSLFSVVGSELDTLVNRAQDFRTALTGLGPNLQPSQFGNGAFAAQIRSRNPAPVAQTATTTQNITIGDVIVQVEQATDERNPVTIGRAIQRATRQGLIRSQA